MLLDCFFVDFLLVFSVMTCYNVAHVEWEVNLRIGFDLALGEKDISIQGHT